MVKFLLVKPQNGQPLVSVDHFRINSNGQIEGNIVCSPLRQVLITNVSTMQKFQLKPGDLRENIVIDDDNLYSYKSGTVLKIGDLFIRLTFLCEPCFKIKEKVSLNAILYQRGFLGQFLSAGVLKLNDTVTITGKELEAIPYNSIERIKWFLKKNTKPVFASDMIWQIGLAPAYCRALPNIFKKHADIDYSLIRFKKSI